MSILTTITLGTITACIGTTYAVKQYKLAARLAKDKERRDSIVLAASECTRYGTILLPELNRLSQQMRDSGCEYFKHFKFERLPGELQPDISAITPEDEKQMEPFGIEYMRLLNSLEGFAIPFDWKVADDDVGFATCGPSFILVFEYLFAISCRSDLKRYFGASQRLYFRWCQRTEFYEQRQKHLTDLQRGLDSSEAILRQHTSSPLILLPLSAARRMIDELAKPKIK